MIESLRHVRAFLAVAHQGSFTRASAELHVSQPALTVQIQQLEASLGTALFTRTKRKVALTQAGHDLLPRLEQLLADAEAIMGTARRDVVTVAAVPSLAATLLPGALVEFRRLYPGVVVRLRDSVGDLLELVKSGEVDFGVGGELQRDRAVAVEDLYVEPMCVFALDGHPLAGRDEVTLAEVAEHPAILPRRSSSLRAILDQAFDAQHIVPNPLHETSHLSTTIGMVNAGLGVAILPRRALECCVSPRIRCVRIVRPVIERTVILATHVGHALSPAVMELIAILRQRAAKPADGEGRPDPPPRLPSPAVSA